MDVPKPYEFIGFGAMDVPKPYEFIRFGAMEVTKPYKFIGFGAGVVFALRLDRVGRTRSGSRQPAARCGARPGSEAHQQAARPLANMAAGNMAGHNLTT